MSTLAQMLARGASGNSAGAFAEEPVPLSVFVQDQSYLGNPPLSLVQYDAVRHAERIYYPETYDVLAQSSDPEIRLYWEQPCRMVNFLDLEWGKGSGKDHSSRIMSLRVVYLLLCLKSPQAYFELPEQDTIHLLNVATSSSQASRAFFAPMRRAVSRQGNWFQNVSEAVEMTGRRRDPAKTLMNLVRFDKNVEAISGHSDADSQEGLNLIMGVADEIDGFKSRAEQERERGARARESSSSAESIIEMLRTSASTRFPKTYKNVRISYPRYLGSTIQKLVAEARQDIEERGERSKRYVSGPLCTWDVNPRVSKEDFEEDYRKDRALAEAKYECRPSRAVNPYFGNEPALRAASFAVSRQPLIIEDYVKDGAAWKPVYDFSRDLKPVQGARYAMHADLAVKGDRAGVAMAHVQKWEERDVVGEGPMGEDVHTSEIRPIVRVDFVISFQSNAASDPPLEIQIRWYRMLALELRRRGFNIALCSADGFQSVDTLQLLQAHGIEVDKFSTDRSDIHWQSLRDLAYESRLKMPHREFTLTELLGLSRLPNGKIDHLGDGSKDEADALACSITGALQVGGEEDPDGLQAYPGGSVEEWSGPSMFDLPQGFQDPSMFTPDEVMRVPVPVDGRGMPDFWEMGMLAGVPPDDGASHSI